MQSIGFDGDPCDCFMYFLSEFIFHCFKSMFLYFSVNACYYCHCYCVVN